MIRVLLIIIALSQYSIYLTSQVHSFEMTQNQFELLQDELPIISAFGNITSIPFGLMFLYTRDGTSVPKRKVELFGINDELDSGEIYLSSEDVWKSVEMYGDAFEFTGLHHSQIKLKGFSEPDLFANLDGDYNKMIHLENQFDDWKLGFYRDLDSLEDYFAFEYEGNIITIINHNGVAFAISDERVKNNITNLSLVLPSLMKLTPSYYETTLNPNSTEIGFIAQNVLEHFPQLVNSINHQGDKYYSVNYNGMLPIITKGIQEQNEKLNTSSDLIKDNEEIIHRLQSKVGDITNLIKNK